MELGLRDRWWVLLGHSLALAPLEALDKRGGQALVSDLTGVRLMT